MSMSKNIARLAVTAGLTAALSFGGVMAPVTMAFADGTPTVATNGNVTITEDIYKDTTFKGIRIFSAKVTQDQKDDGTYGKQFDQRPLVHQPRIADHPANSLKRCNPAARSAIRSSWSSRPM